MVIAFGQATEDEIDQSSFLVFTKNTILHYTNVREQQDEDILSCCWMRLIAALSYSTTKLDGLYAIVQKKFITS